MTVYAESVLIFSKSIGGVSYLFFFFFNDTATTEIYTLSLHDALPISQEGCRPGLQPDAPDQFRGFWRATDRKSTRLNSSHLVISYAVFCLKKKKAGGYQLRPPG